MSEQLYTLYTIDAYHSDQYRYSQAILIFFYYHILTYFCSFRPRFGLFSLPASTAIGDNATYKPKKPRITEDGEVETDPRNFYTTKMKSGQADDVYFMRPTYVATGDPFKQAALLQMGRSEVKDGHLKAGHEKAFCPAKVVTHAKKDARAAYDYMEVGPVKKESFRDEDGEVKIGSRNFLTNPMKRGRVGLGTSLGGVVEYMPEDYDLSKKLARQDREYHESKIQEKPFSQRAGPLPHFNSHKQVFMEEPMVPHRKPPVPPEPPVTHEVAWRPTKTVPHEKANGQAFNGTIPYVYLENPTTPLKRKVQVDEEEKPGFKATYKGLSGPTASVATNLRNLKSQFPKSFARSPSKSPSPR